MSLHQLIVKWPKTMGLFFGLAWVAAEVLWEVVHGWS